MQRIARALAVLVVIALSLGGTFAAVAAAGQAGGSKKEVLATLKVEETKVEVKKKGAEKFKTAKDGQKLREGDTIRTDATGRAEVDYSDDAYTRLDVNTTFTITKLTEEEGARQVEGSLDTGRTWNRTEAVTESGSFEQSGAGATAAVVGTAFSVECALLPNPDPSAEPEKVCSWLGVYHEIVLRSGNGEVRDIPEFGECSSVQPTDTSDGDLCDEVHQLTADDIAAIDWVQANLLRDLLEHNFGPGPVLTAFNVVVENGQVVAVTQLPTQPAPLAITATTSSSTTSSSSTTTTTTTLAPPSIDDPPINVSGGGNNANPTPYSVPPTGPQSSIVTEDEVGTSNPVVFTVNLSGPDGAVLKVKFTELPGGEFGVIQWFDPESGVEGEWVPVVADDPYDDGEEFRFVPMQYEAINDCQSATTTSPEDFASCYAPYPDNVTNNEDGTVSWTTSFTIQAVDEQSGGGTSPTTVIPIEIVDDVCVEGPARVACDLVTTTSFGGSSVSDDGTTVTTLATVTTDAPPTTAATTTTAPTDPPTTEETTATTGADAG